MGEGARRGVDDVQDRVTIQEAARRLGISEGAVRKRVTRGTLEHAKERDGRVYVYLDRGVQRVDDGQDTGVDPNSGALISRLEDEIAYLREESRRKDEIIMQQAVSMRQLSAPSESPENVTRGQQEEEPPTGAEGPENQSSQASPRPWWRRVFGG
jgi:hypothetical protein